MNFGDKMKKASKGGRSFGSNHPVAYRVLVLVIALLFSCYFLEFPFNPAFLATIEPQFIPTNLFILGVLLLIFYFAGQQTRISIFLFEALCLLLGMGNHYLMDFKGTPVIPSDLFALGTAAEVAGGYSLTPDPQVLFALLVFILFSIALFAFVPKISLSKKKVIIHSAIALVLVFGFVYGFLNDDMRKRTGAYIYAFHIDQSYQSQGTPLCFVALGQSMLVKAPDDYSADEQKKLAEDALATYEAENPGASQVKPTVVCIMGESFMDMTIFDELKDCEEAYPSNFYDIASESIVAGYSYASGFGASTCNSEFEFLTGSSMAFCGGGSYPYMYYDLSNTGNLARYFKSQGYEATAVHPAEGGNWNRTKVYKQLGFDRFLTVDDFPEAELLRGKTTDKETYKKVLDLIDSSDEPQFIFDITYASHGGYVSHLVDDSIYVEADVQGKEYDYLNEYLSCIMQSDRDLKWLVDQLKKRDEPVILCFFGDHAPNFVNKICGSDDTQSGSDRVAQSQKRYTTPYLIWANYPVATPEIAVNPTSDLVQRGTTKGYSSEPLLSGCLRSTNFSFGYLSTAVIEATGLPMDERAASLAQLREELPLVNSIGYMDTHGNWHRHSEGYTKNMSLAIEKYKSFQYWNLFDAVQD